MPPAFCYVATDPLHPTETVPHLCKCVFVVTFTVLHLSSRVTLANHWTISPHALLWQVTEQFARVRFKSLVPFAAVHTKVAGMVAKMGLFCGPEAEPSTLGNVLLCLLKPMVLFATPCRSLSWPYHVVQKQSLHSAVPSRPVTGLCVTTRPPTSGAHAAASRACDQFHCGLACSLGLGCV
eukprot:scaffold219182_cov37-Tisochrysis_lutea.AAC.3